MSNKKTNPRLEVNSSGQTLLITGAFIKNEKCKYLYNIVKGPGAGDSHTVDSKNIVEKSMYDALSKCNIHLAVIDDAFKIADVQIGDITLMNGHEITLKYTVTGFKLKGTENAITVVLIGTKQSTNGRMFVETPEILLDERSGYEWWQDLKDRIFRVSVQVQMYKDGHYVDSGDKNLNNPNQTDLFLNGEDK